MRISRLCVGLLVAVSGAAWADLPLTGEDLITDKGKVKLDVSLVYANSAAIGSGIMSGVASYYDW